MNDLRKVITNVPTDKVLHVLWDKAVVLRFGTTKYIYQLEKGQSVIDVYNDTVVDVLLH